MRLAGTLAAFVPLVLYPLVTRLWPGSARYYQIIASTYSPPLTLALIPMRLLSGGRAKREEQEGRAAV